MLCGVGCTCSGKREGPSTEGGETDGVAGVIRDAITTTQGRIIIVISLDGFNEGQRVVVPSTNVPKVALFHRVIQLYVSDYGPIEGYNLANGA